MVTKSERGRRGCDRMVVGFTTTYAISSQHHWCCEFESRPGWGVQHYVMKLISDFRQVGGFLRVLRFPPPIKLTVTINTTKQTNKQTSLREMDLSLFLNLILHYSGTINFNESYILQTIALSKHCLPGEWKVQFMHNQAWFTTHQYV